MKSFGENAPGMRGLMGEGQETEEQKKTRIEEGRKMLELQKQAEKQTADFFKANPIPEEKLEAWEKAVKDQANFGKFPKKN